eukprot:TRINITY_DN13479_c0_g1_i4.p1 TRINITY_DN13479_c0_g1~~TRINITY_DN13479_c0_g1_i4.p1  ORF type:complete len:141 (+),score=24.75 TRINITY_DN13479_c0_g1_i4:156-578(+)
MTDEYSSQLVPEEEQGDIDKEVFAKGQMLLNAEVEIILDIHITSKQSKDMEYQPPETLKRVIDHVKRFNPIKSRSSVTSIRGLCAEFHLRAYEVALIVNLMPRSAEEAIALIPSLGDGVRFNEEQLQQLLDEVYGAQKVD